MTGSFSVSGNRNRTSFFVTVVIFVLLFALGEFVAKWYPYTLKIEQLVRFPSWTSNSILKNPQNSGSVFSFLSGFEFLRSYFSAIWLALTAGIVIAAGIDVLIPNGWLESLLRRRNSKTGVLVGGLLSVPCMMCTCCSAPIARSMLKSGARKSSVLAFWIGNPVLNPAVITFLALVGPWQWVALRVVFGLLLVFGISVIIDIFGKDNEVGQTLTPMDRRSFEIPRSLSSGLKRYVWSILRLSVALIPEYVVIVFLLGACSGWIFPLIHGSASIGLVSLVVVAGLATIVVIPTAGELPIVLSLATLGASPVILGCLLITLPAISLPSAAMVGRSFGWNTVLMAALSVAIVGIAGGVALALLWRI